MANTFKVVTFAAEPASAGTPYTIYTTPASTTTVVIGLILTNIHTMYRLAQSRSLEGKFRKFWCRESEIHVQGE